MIITDNRRHGRVPVRFPVLQFFDSKHLDADAKAVDLSYSGIRLKDSTPSNIGSQYTLAFSLPATQGTILAGVKVAHQKDGFEGLRFVDMEAKDLQKFYRWMDVQLVGRWFQL